MLDYPGLLAVASVVREGSFEKAAKALGVTPSAVSQRVKLLEARMGAILIVRGQPCTATAEGELVCRHVEQVAMLEDGLAQQLPALGETPGGGARPTLPIAVNADSLATWFLEAAAAFAESTGCLLDIAVDDQDHTAEWLRTGRVIGAVTAHGAPVQGFRSTRLGVMRYRAVASPAFVAAHFPGGVTAAALSRAPTLVYDRKDRLQETWVRQVVGEVPRLPTHWIPSSHAFVEAGRLGIGWGMSPELLLDRTTADGALVDLAPDHPVDVGLYWQVRGIAVEQVRSLTRAIVATARVKLRA